METYTVRAQRDGRWWALTSPELPGFFSQVRNLGEAEAMAIDGIALLLDRAPDSFLVKIRPDLEEELLLTIADALEAKKKADLAEERRARLMAQAVDGLLSSGLTVRDAAKLLGVSHQWVAKLGAKPPSVIVMDMRGSHGQTPAKSIKATQRGQTSSPQYVGSKRRSPSAGR